MDKREGSGDRQAGDTVTPYASSLGDALPRYASRPDGSRGRFHPEDGRRSGPELRNAFGRDRDRIVHSVPFRRLRGKTQVFVAPDGDHFRVRLTHSLEVAQIARTLARALGLNEDLTEAIALAHDIGHPPFGHAGEAALTAAVADVGGFDHNAHTLRVLTRIESPYPLFPGLNLTFETLEGLAKHNGPARSPTWALQKVNTEWPLDLATWPSLEAQVASVADDIAYDNHDIDDGLRAGLIDFDALLEESLVAEGWDAVTRRYPGVTHAQLVPELIRDRIGHMVGDVLEESRARIARVAPQSPDDVRGAGEALVGFSAAVAEQERSLKRFMYARFYHHPRQLEIAEQAGRIVGGLVAAYRTDPALLPAEWRERLSHGEPERGRHIADFIAGMTDRYAISRYRELVGPIAMPEGF